MQSASRLAHPPFGEVGRGRREAMEASNLQIYWHESQPIYSLCFQPTDKTSAAAPKLVTAGGDNKVRIWNLNMVDSATGDKMKVDSIDFLASLTQHEQAVNVVRFNNKGDVLASAGDDGQLLLWRQDDTNSGMGQASAPFGSHDEEDNKESWYVSKKLRIRNSTSYEIYDIAWAPTDQYIATGSMDNTIRIFDAETGECICHCSDHNHYVQGIVWDPLNEFILSQSADRSLNVYQIIFDNSTGKIQNLKFKHRILRAELPTRSVPEDSLDFGNKKTSYIFHNETLPSFFRRASISPCGGLVAVPTGIFKNDTSNNATDFNNAVYFFSRSGVQSNSSKPIMRLPFLRKPAIIVSFNPNFYSKKNQDSYIKLDYKLIFAVATSNEVIIYDTENVQPLAVIGNLHYTPLTDLTWSKDGTLLMVSSTDGFCSYISIKKELLGETIEAIPKKLLLMKKEETPKKKDIVNILPVKRKTEENTATTTTSNKEKRRIQPTLVID